MTRTEVQAIIRSFQTVSNSEYFVALNDATDIRNLPGLCDDIRNIRKALDYYRAIDFEMAQEESAAQYPYSEYGKEVLANKARRAERRRRNAKSHKADRLHGKNITMKYKNRTERAMSSSHGWFDRLDDTTRYKGNHDGTGHDADVTIYEVWRTIRHRNGSMAVKELDEFGSEEQAESCIRNEFEKLYYTSRIDSADGDEFTFRVHLTNGNMITYRIVTR